ncbi:MAG: hypothetical protein JXR21_03390 [Candidatus Marinimicrobia bacterium]|nr:hypothetical protein [Candidatus Neomarinimicrobiota bacterium]
MKRLLPLLVLCGLLAAQTSLEYKEKYKDPVHAKIKALRENAETEENDPGEKPEYTLFASLAGMEYPVSQDIFTTCFHFPPKHQGLTSTCWAHAGISFIESEVQKKQNTEIKLSVMYVVYHEYLEKALAFIESKGKQELRLGSQISSVFDIADTWGLVPEADYTGNPTPEGFDTKAMTDALRACLDEMSGQNNWDKDLAVPAIRAILDKHLGKVPETVSYGGKTYTPKNFYKKVLKFRPMQYTAIQSTLSHPFFEYRELPFPDNWRHDDMYLNLPVDAFYHAIRRAVKDGCTVPIGGDTSEPGYNRYAGIAFIPVADVPADDIDDDVREYRIYGGSTGDDHAVHIVGYAEFNGEDWFLIKDSSRSAYTSDHPGYYFYRGDYIRLKMLTAVLPNEYVGY